MSVLAVMVSFVGVVIDGVGNTQIDAIKTCASATSYYNVDGYVYYGDQSYDDDAKTCIQTYYTADTDCYCVDSNKDCFFLNGQTDCNVILTSYTTNLKAAIALDVLCFVSVLAFSIVTCFSICCPYGFRKKKTSNFKNELKDDDRASATTNPLQNDKRPILERVATFGRMKSGMNFSGWNNTSTAGSGQTVGAHTGGGSSTENGGETKSTAKKGGDVSTFVNPLAKKDKKTDTTDSAGDLRTSASNSDGAFSSSVADFQFESGEQSKSNSVAPPPPPPPPPKSNSATPGALAVSSPGGDKPATPSRPAPMIGGGMSANPLARKKVLPRTASGMTNSASDAATADATRGDDATKLEDD